MIINNTSDTRIMIIEDSISLTNHAMVRKGQITEIRKISAKDYNIRDLAKKLGEKGISTFLIDSKTIIGYNNETLSIPLFSKVDPTLIRGYIIKCGPIHSLEITLENECKNSSTDEPYGILCKLKLEDFESNSDVVRSAEYLASAKKIVSEYHERILNKR